MASFNLDDLLNIEPSKVSRDLSGYITYLYGMPKVGKTTFARDMNALIMECEAGTNALSGAYGMKMQNWADIKALARFLKDDRMKDKYKAIAVDTVDVAAALCEKYICSQYNISALGELGYGKGWTAFKKEFEDVFRGITMQGYAVLFISHVKDAPFTRPDGTEYTRIMATVSTSINNIIKNMSDIIGYAYQDLTDNERYLMLRSIDGTVDVGCRFKYIEPRIKFGYDHLVEALNRAIDKEEEMSGPGSVTSERKKTDMVELDFDSLMKEFNNIVANIPGSADSTQSTPEGRQFAEFWIPRIQEIGFKYLGKGMKISQCTRGQVEQLSLIVDDMKELVKG